MTDTVDSLAVPRSEQAVLGAILMKPKLYFSVVEIVQPEHFHTEGNRRIFAGIAELFNTNKDLDVLTLTDYFAKTKALSRVGGVAYISSLTDGILATDKSVRNHAGIVRDAARRRQLSIALENALARTSDRSTSLDDIAGEIENDLLSVTAEATKQSVMHVRDFAGDVWRDVEAMANSEHKLEGISFGIDALDESTGGMRPKEVIVVGGWSGTGKTAFVGQVADHCCQNGGTVGVFSPEMSKDELLKRSVSRLTGVAHNKVQEPKRCSKEELRRIAEGFAECSGWNLYVDDTPNITVNQLIARARALANKGVKLFVIDYVQLLHVPHETEPRLKMSYASRAITEFTKANKVSTLVLSQLVKPKEQAGKRRPNKYDLRETGQLIDDAHLILLLHRPVGADGEEKDYEAVIIIDKQRRGLTGDIPAYFAGKHVKWQWRDETKRSKKADAVEERDKSGEKSGDDHDNT